MKRWTRQLYHLANNRLDKRLTRPLLVVIHFSVALWRQNQRDHLFVRAGMLAYWSTVAIVPMLLLAFALTGAIGLADEAVRWLLYDTLLASNVVNDVGNQLDSFLTGTTLSTLGLVGVLSILLIGAHLYFQTEQAYNDIFYTKPSHNLISRFFGFYAALTLAPLLISSGFLARDQVAGIAGTTSWIAAASVVVPSILAAVAFVFAIRFLPSTKVSWKAAFTGGTFSAVLFLAARHAFGAYVDLLGTKDSMAVIYGSLALLPVFLIWLNVVWTIVLTGVEVAYVVENWDALVEQQHRWVIDPFARQRKPDFFYALAVLSVVCDRYSDGHGGSSPHQIGDALDADSRQIRMTLNLLETAGVLIESEEKSFLPAVPIDRTPTAEVLNAWRRVTAPSYPDKFPGRAAIDKALSELQVSLKEPLAETLVSIRPTLDNVSKKAISDG